MDEPQTIINKAGRLISFEGVDASGKSTQVRLFQEWLQRKRIPYAYLSFPRMDMPGYGEAIAMFLRGEFGPVDSVHPYLIASLFAGDRLIAKPEIVSNLARGMLVVVDRYFLSNMAFQCAKISSHPLRAAFAQWITRLEYEVNGIPRPDFTMVFDPPFSFVERQVSQRLREDRAYLGTKADIHETSLDLQRRVAGQYQTFAQADPTVVLIQCGDADGAMLPAEVIHEKVLHQITDRGIIPC